MTTTQTTNDHPHSTDHWLLTTGLTSEEQKHLAAELTGCPAGELLKVRATADGLVVVIHTGQKFIYDLAAVQAAVERLAAGAGRLAREVFLAELDADAQALLAARAAQTAPARGGRGAGKTGGRKAGGQP